MICALSLLISLKEKGKTYVNQKSTALSQKDTAT